MTDNPLSIWFHSTFEPDKFPQALFDSADRTLNLTQFAHELWVLDIPRLEALFNMLPGLLRNQDNPGDFVQAIDANQPTVIDPMKQLLIGEMVLDYLILDENWEQCANRSTELLDLARKNRLLGEVAILLNYRGVCAYRRADYVHARDDLSESLKIAEELVNNRQRARASINLGLVYKDMGQLEEAAQHYKLALKLAREQDDSRTVLSSYLNIGNIFRELKRWDEGKTALRNGINLALELGDKLEEIRGRLNLGVLQLEEGKNIGVAEGFFRQVIKEASESDAEQLEWIARSNLGLALLRLGKLDESIEESMKCRENAVKTSDNDSLWRTDANLALAFRKQKKTLDSENHYRLAISEFDLLRRGLKSDRDRSEFQRNLENLQEEFVQYGLDAHGPDTAFARLAKSKGRALNQTLEQLSGVSTAIESDEQLLKRIQLSLSSRPGSILVDYFLSGDSIKAFVCDSAEVTVHDLTAGPDLISSLLKELSGEINLFIASQEYRQAWIDRDAATPDLFRNFYDALILPFDKKLTGAGHLIFVPMGLLHEVPFLALAGSSNRYLVESHAVSILPASDFILAHPAWGKKENEIEKVVLFRGSEEGLEATKLERDALETLFGKKLTEVDMNSQGEEYWNSRFSSDHKDADIIHFLGHAEFDQANPYSSALIFPNGNLLRFSDFDSNPLDLRGVGLVTLAACETARGQVVAGDEVIGIGRGFLGSGAANLMASLWKVTDDIVADFMPVFYESLLAGKSPAYALQDGVMSLINTTRRHPYFFAPFQIYGAS
jgi:CHAT domain-containing protein